MPEILSQETETEQLKLQESISELIETERTYVARLMTTYKIYVVGGQNILTESDRNQIFSNLDEILIVNDNFFQDLQRCYDMNKCQGIGETFLKHIPNFSIYLVYCRNQTSSIKFLQRKMKDPMLSNYIKESLFRPECNGLDLASFLLEPVQRLTRYPMLLKQIQKYTMNPSEECNLLSIAIEESEGLLERVNKSMLEGEEFEQLSQIQRRLSIHGKFSHSENFSRDGKLPENLAGLTRNFGERKLLKTGIWTKLRSRRNLLVLLFSDFLLLTEAASGETDLNLLRNEEAKLKIYRKAIHLDDIWLMKESETSKIPNQYQNCYDLRALELEAHDNQPLLIHVSSEEFEEWIDTISIAKRKLKSIFPANNSSNQQSSAPLGSIRLTILCATTLPSDFQYYVLIHNGALEQSFSTNPSRGPLPVWNQTFTLPVRSLKSEINFELLKYDQYKVNESFGEYKIELECLQGLDKDTMVCLNYLNGIDLKIKLEYIPKLK